ncbi:bifunctional (p)ppGpp synthetase/guanosine-3',5'-bis(diphosphate) 3'-pyrophosphohydrolase [Natroniella sulfidigena]|uniref:RelA/SpoT family protein n=1 Tax=Natroniella sulfidigena TaxID=723921 RepID=UPI00200B1EA3|nr:bifunctional (p)ppGpp synthetase/guanosine-3',5'-bis(diphosphate) 3'-pyrophosphohydrolase [Natroniella sulfidigena]MCK8815977.1 bifunctional (p)ppGpp synthetase/guanosine-3',5'-bis(diphosphate) 3'-pyrophosphohydrolase [Natroniella sulfidigena]
MSLQKLLTEVESYTENPNLELIEEAYHYAKEFHQGQYRVSGEPFVSHPLNVAQIMAELELDVISIVGALLHDVVEDTEVTEAELEKEFGSEVTLLVSGVTKLSKIDFKSREEHQAESLRKMFLAMAKDIRVILIKLADRLHNMRTLQYLSEEKQKIKATETLEIYAPLAHRLGMSRLKWELEDLSFRYLEPNKYYELVNKVAKNRDERESYIENVIDQVNNKLLEVGIKAKIYGRPKHLYSIYQKMVKQDKEFREIYDLTALRVIVNSVKECYQTLGLIHDLWNPMPGRIKDYVAMPKSNMYQSLHTTVIGPKGEPLEIQIRTWEMHRTAEYGIAAHWRYKSGNQKEQDFEEKISWLRQLLEWQKDLQDAKEFMETLKVDLFEDEVFVFTPNGDVVSLPKGASPVDFAYNIHTEIGHNCVGAKVNGKMIPLEYRLKNGDIVEIITSANSGPSRDWVNFVKTSRAKSKIKRWFRNQRKEEVAAKGKEMLETRLNKEDVNLKEEEKNKKLKEIAEKIGATTIESLYTKIGYNKVSVLDIVKKLKPQKKKPSPETELKKLKKHSNISNRSRNKGVRVKGMDDLLVRISKCCNPLPGDQISGYITRGRGISVHRSDCPNLKNLIEQEEERIIDVEWHVDQETSYEVEIEVEAWNQRSLLNDLTSVISEAKINITSANVRTTKDRLAYINISLEISSLEHMKDIMKKLEQTEGVLSVQRANPA